MAEHVGDDDGWATQLRAAIEAEPLAPSLADAVRPMAGVRFIDADGADRALDRALGHPARDLATHPGWQCCFPVQAPEYKEDYQGASELLEEFEVVFYGEVQSRA